MSDILYENQKLASKKDKFPLFAPRQCNHNVSWGQGYNNEPIEFGAMLIKKYGEEQAVVESMKIVTSCPVCCKSWCD
jgi:hypothetical protein